jgi:hypothetical protein
VNAILMSMHAHFPSAEMSKHAFWEMPLCALGNITPPFVGAIVLVVERAKHIGTFESKLARLSGVDELPWSLKCWVSATLSRFKTELHLNVSLTSDRPFGLGWDSRATLNDV